MLNPIKKHFGTSHNKKVRANKKFPKNKTVRNGMKSQFMNAGKLLHCLKSVYRLFVHRIGSY